MPEAIPNPGTQVRQIRVGCARPMSKLEIFKFAPRVLLDSRQQLVLGHRASLCDCSSQLAFRAQVDHATALKKAVLWSPQAI